MTPEQLCARHCGLASCRLAVCIVFDPQRVDSPEDQQEERA